MQHLILRVEHLACEEHLRDSPLVLPCDLEVQVRRTRAAIEGVRAGLNRRESEPPFAVCELDAVALKSGSSGAGFGSDLWL